MNEVGSILKCLSAHRFSLSDEKETQAEIAQALDMYGIHFKREHRLDPRSIIDFMHPEGTGTEIKLKGSKMAIYRQMERYAEFDVIKRLILVTNVPTGFPKELIGKPVYVLNLSKAWL